MIWNQILCFGDSLTYGARDEYGRSYPAELSKLLWEDTKEFYFCHNHGVNGETSSDLLKRCWRVINGHRDCKIICLLVGTNDTKCPTPEDIYSDNLRQLVGVAKSQGMTVIVGTLPPLGFSPFYLHNTDYIDKYSKIITDNSENWGYKVCDLSGLGEHLIDGVHFGNNGYKEIANLFFKAIKEYGKSSDSG